MAQSDFAVFVVLVLDDFLRQALKQIPLLDLSPVQLECKLELIVMRVRINKLHPAAIAAELVLVGMSPEPATAFAADCLNPRVSQPGLGKADSPLCSGLSYKVLYRHLMNAVEQSFVTDAARV